MSQSDLLSLSAVHYARPLTGVREGIDLTEGGNGDTLFKDGPGDLGLILVEILTNVGTVLQIQHSVRLVVF